MKLTITIAFFITLLFGCNAKSSEIVGVWEWQYAGDSPKIKELMTISKSDDGHIAEIYGWDFIGSYRTKIQALTVSGNEIKIGLQSGVYIKSTDQLAIRGKEYIRLSKEEAALIKSKMDSINETYLANQEVCKAIQLEVNAKQAEGDSMSKEQWNNWVGKIGERVPPGCTILGDGKRF